MVMITTDTYDADVGLSIDHSFHHDSIALEADNNFVYLKRLDPLNVQMGNRLDQQLNPHMITTWHHDFNHEWSLNTDDNDMYINPIDTDPYNPMDKHHTAPFPIFDGTVVYTKQ